MNNLERLKAEATVGRFESDVVVPREEQSKSSDSSRRE